MVCGVAAGATIVVAGTAAHIGVDALSNSLTGDYAVKRALGHPAISVGVAGTCVNLLGAGCAKSVAAPLIGFGLGSPNGGQNHRGDQLYDSGICA